MFGGCHELSNADAVSDDGDNRRRRLTVIPPTVQLILAAILITSNCREIHPDRNRCEGLRGSERHPHGFDTLTLVGRGLFAISRDRADVPPAGAGCRYGRASMRAVNRPRAIPSLAE